MCSCRHAQVVSGLSKYISRGARGYNSTCFFEFLMNQVHWIMCLPQDFSERSALSLMQIPSPSAFQSSRAVLDGSVTRGCSRRTDNNYSNIKNRVLKKFETSTLLLRNKCKFFKLIIILKGTQGMGWEGDFLLLRQAGEFT